MIEVTIAIAILAIVGVGTSATLATSTGSSARNRESALAHEGIQGVLDAMRALPREEVFARYNADAADDPAAGAAPGAAFDVLGLQPTAEDPDQRVGRVEFPGDNVVLREDVVHRELGMPRDLNGDAQIDALDHALDYVALPVRISITYLGQNGPRTISFVTLL